MEIKTPNMKLQSRSMMSVAIQWWISLHVETKSGSPMVRDWNSNRATRASRFVLSTVVDVRVKFDAKIVADSMASSPWNVFVYH